MHRKIIAITFVALFVLMVFNSSIAAEVDTNRITMKRDLINARRELKELNKNVIESCIETEDYSRLLKFMGEGSQIERNVHINATGSGLYLVKNIRLVKLVHPYTRFQQGFPPNVMNLWLFYIKFNETYPEVNYSLAQGKYVETGNQLNASTFIEYEDGSPSKYINGSHSILALVIQFPPLNKLMNTCNLLNRWIKSLTGKKDTMFNISWPWSVEKWKFRNFWNWYTPLPATVAVWELMLMIMNFNVWTSFLNLRWASGIRGMAPIVIWNNSTASP
jgi:hypothetical protein